MEWFIAIIAVVVAGLTWLAMQGRLGGMPPLIDDRPGPDLPEGDIASADLREVHFAVVTRGYSMPQVDAVLDRLADQLENETPRSDLPDDSGALGWPLPY
jgi:DivIVA domain-containing protein